MKHTIINDATLLMKQAATTAAFYFREAIDTIDEQFDEPGYAKKHPELVAAFMRTCAADYQAAMTLAASENITGAVERLVDED